MTDTLPSGVTLSSATGTGWSCAASGLTITCQRTNPTATLAAGASLPLITVVTDVPTATPAGTTFTNSATVTGRTFDPKPANNTGQRHGDGDDQRRPVGRPRPTPGS